MDRKIERLLLFGSLMIYSYFHAGWGWNQHAHFNTVRALVETRSFELTRRVNSLLTGDVSVVDSRIYSNKPPGLPLLCTPVYMLLAGIEKLYGLELQDPLIMKINIWLLAVWGSALPAAVLVQMIFLTLRRKGISTRSAGLLAGAFAMGTLVFPHASALMSHNLTAVLIFGAWMIVTSQRPAKGSTLIAGALIGAAILVDLLAAPCAAIFALWLLWQRRSFRAVTLFCIGPTIALLAMAGYNLAIFGHITDTAYQNTSARFHEQKLMQHIVEWPDWRMIYWLTIHPHRGLFYSSPMLLFAVAGIFTLPPRSKRAAWALALAIACYFFIFNMLFTGWTGGYGVGLRYLIPSLAFLLLLASAMMLRHPIVAGVAVAASVLNMFVLTSITIGAKAKSLGPPINVNPTAEGLARFFSGKLPDGGENSNLGLALGLRGYASLLPALLLIVLFFWMLWQFNKRVRA